LREARAWYASREEHLGDQFIAAVDAAVRRVVTQPLAFPTVPRVPSARRALLRRFPFSIVFRMLGEEVIEVLAVAHTSRRPGYWRARMR
jgi:toxin ParE1/3/4